MGGAIYYLSGTAQFTIIKTLVNMGFNGHPRGAAGIVASHRHHLLLAVHLLHTGGRRIAAAGVCQEIIDIIIAAIIYRSAFALLVQGGIARLLSRKHERAAGKEED